MKRRNADAGKLRRPIKRTKITEGMYGNTMLYVRFVILWSCTALADYMLEYRFEFLWPLWLMIKEIYHSYHCKGLAFTIFFICVVLTLDLIFCIFIPMQILTYIAGVYVWVNTIWHTFESKGVCVQTVAMWLLVVYAEAVRAGVIYSAMGDTLADEPDDWTVKPWAAGALGFPIVAIGTIMKEFLDEKLMLRMRRQVWEQNEFYFRLMREAIPEGGLLSSTYSCDPAGETERGREVKQNGSAKRRFKPDTNGHCVRDKERAALQVKLEHLEQYVERKNRARDSSSQSTQSQKSTGSVQASVQSSAQPSPHAGHTNGAAKGPGWPAENSYHCKGGSKSTKNDKKDAKEERRRKKNKDIDKENIDSHKSKHVKEQNIDKDLECTKECVKVKECNNIHKEEEKRKDEERKREKEEEIKKEKEAERKREKEEEAKRDKEEERKRRKEEERKREEVRKREREEERRRIREEERKREKERDRELKEREKQKEKERERERELLSARELAEEAARLRAALALAQRGEAECARQLAAEKQRRTAQLDLKHQLQHKISTWRCGERAALERKLGEERRLRLVAEQQLLKAKRTPHGECENEMCKSRRIAAETEAALLRKDLQRTRDRLTQTQRDLNQANDQVAALEAENSACAADADADAQNDAAWRALHARAAHLQRALSAETRVKLDLLSALGDANRKMRIHESVINRQEKELEELKAQMLAVMPAELVSPSPTAVSKMRLSEGSPLDPNATIYMPKQLCSDA